MGRAVWIEPATSGERFDKAIEAQDHADRLGRRIARSDRGQGTGFRTACRQDLRASLVQRSEPFQETVPCSVAGREGKDWVAFTDQRHRTVRDFGAAEGFGMNPRARLVGNVLEDEKVRGTCYFAIGDNTNLGGSASVGIHVTGVLRNPKVMIDDFCVLHKGDLVVCPVRHSQTGAAHRAVAPLLLNPYGVILVNPVRHPYVKAKMGQAFID